MIPGAVMSPPCCTKDEMHFALYSLFIGRRYGALVWFSLCWRSRGCQLCWPSQTADQPSSRCSSLSLTQSRDSSSSLCTVPCAERSVGYFFLYNPNSECEMRLGSFGDTGPLASECKSGFPAGRLQERLPND